MTTSLLIVLIAAVTLLAIAGSVIASLIFANDTNTTVKRRRENYRAIEEGIYTATVVVVAGYIILVSASGIFRGESLIYGLLLAAIGLLIAAATYVVCYLLAIRIWNAAYQKYHRQQIRMRRLQKQSDDYRLQRDGLLRMFDLHNMATKMAEER